MTADETHALNELVVEGHSFTNRLPSLQGTACSGRFAAQRAQRGGLPCLHTGVVLLGGASFGVK